MRRLITVLVVLLAACNAGLVAPTASPAPIPTAAPTSTPSAPPTPSPGATASTLPSIPPTEMPNGLQVDANLISRHLDALQQIADDNGGIRAAGTPGYDASADYVAQVMSALGYTVERQPFEFPFYDEAEPVTLSVGDQTWTSPEWLHAALYSGDGDVEGPLRFVGTGSFTNGCDSNDWNGFAAGSVAMVEGGGGCYTRQKVELAQSAGAAAMISLYPTWAMNEIKRPTLLGPGITIPVVAAGREPWAAIVDLDGVTARVSVRGDARTATVENIIATLPGQTERVVMLGGHLDSVLDGPGINDNGSGVATLMSMAASLAAQPQPVATVRFGFWSAEEFGVLGSLAYVEALDASERGLMDAYLNLDMVGSPNPGRFVYDDATSPTGSDELTSALLAAFDALGQPALTEDTGGASDHFGFGEAGIPVGGVFSGLGPMTAQDADLFGGVVDQIMDPCYHLVCDRRDNVDLDNAALLGQAVANVLRDLAYQL